MLANAHWLVTHVASSFGSTAAAYGLSPSGVMERHDQVHGVSTGVRSSSVSSRGNGNGNGDGDNISSADSASVRVNMLTSFRRDWQNGSCRPVHTADPQLLCPNN